MKKLLTSLCLLLAGLTAFGQISMSVGSKVELVPDDADATSYYRQTDVNDNVCAIIKVVPDNSLSGTLVLQTRGGMAPVAPPRGGSNYRQETGEWWYWVSPKVANIMFTSEGYTPTDWIGVSLKPGKVYRMRLNVESSVTIVKTYSGSGLVGVQMTIDPKQARVAYGLSKNEVINFKEITDGYYDAFLAEGSYWFEVSSKFYETWTSNINVKRGMKEVTVKLKPAYNTYNIDCYPDGTDVYVDGEFLGTTPIEQSTKISKGEHMFTFRKDNYYVTNSRETLNGDGSLLYWEVKLKPQFGVVTLLCDDPLADIVVTDPAGKEVFRGKSGSKTQLNSQLTYKVESSRPSHIPQSRGVIGSTIEGQTVDVKVDAPVPMFGELQIQSNPSRAEVWIDGERAGNTIFSQTILIGKHSVELRKDGYDPLTFTVDIQRDQTTQLSKDLKVKSVPQPTPAKPTPAQPSSLSGSENGHEWVDLGLSVKWATCNVGASKPSDKGKQFAWGETSSKGEYTWPNYRFRTSGDSWDNVKISKYVTDSKYGPVDNLTTLSYADDVARQNWGGRWRMPSKEELQELLDKCDCSWITLDGVNGYRCVSKTTGQSIFLPAAGYSNMLAGKELEYWSSTVARPNSAYCLTNWTGSFKVYDLFRYFGMSIRPVLSGESSYSSSAVTGNALVRGDWRNLMKKSFDNPEWTYGNGKYRGQLKDGRNGYGAYWWSEDDDMFFGRYKDGDRDGMGIYFIGKDGRYINNCKDCAYFVGSYSKNIKEGTGTCYDKNGTLIYFGDFKNDAPTESYPMEGRFKAYKFECIEYTNGNMYVGETKDGKRHGWGVFLWTDGGAWFGYWEDGSRNGRGIYYRPSGSYTIGSWKGDDYTAD